MEGSREKQAHEMKREEQSREGKTQRGKPSTKCAHKYKLVVHKKS